MKSRLLLDIVIGKSAAIFQLLTSENQSLLVRRNTLFILNFLFHVLNGITGFDVKGDCFTSQGFNENLHSRTTSQTKDKMKGRLLLDVVIGKSTAIFQLLTSKDQSLLVRRNTFFILNLLLYVLNGITGFDVKGDSLTSQGFNENLHSRTTSKTKNKMKGRLLLDVVIGESTAIFQLFTSENQSLLVGRNSFFILDFLFYILNGITGFDIQSNSLSS